MIENEDYPKVLSLGSSSGNYRHLLDGEMGFLLIEPLFSDFAINCYN